MIAAPAAGVLVDSSWTGDGANAADRPLRKRQKADFDDQQHEHQKDQEKGKEAIFMCLGQPHHPSSPLAALTPMNYKEMPYFSARWSPQLGQAEDPIIAMIARAVQALFGIHVHPFPVDFVNAFKSVMQSARRVPIAASLPLWVLSFHIMDHVVHKKEMALKVQVKLKTDHVGAPFLALAKKFVSKPDQFGVFLSRFLHHLLAEWMAGSTKSVMGSDATLFTLMRCLLSCSLIKWTLFYDRAVQKETSSFNDPSLFCHCVNHLGVLSANSNGSGGVKAVQKCSALYGFGGDHHTIFHHGLLLHPASLGSLSGPLCKSPSIETFIQKDPCSIYWFTIGNQISAALYFDLYQLPRRGSKRYSNVYIVRSPNEGFWWLLQSVSQTPVPDPIDFPWMNQDLFFPCIFGFGPNT
jgi:hypothetical protein